MDHLARYIGGGGLTNRQKNSTDLHQSHGRPSLRLGPELDPRTFLASYASVQKLTIFTIVKSVKFNIILWGLFRMFISKEVYETRPQL
jgi:hypothetical protein